MDLQHDYPQTKERISMTYKRTIRCRYCHGPGHNITNCASRAAHIEELRSLHGDDHYSVRSFDAKRAARAQGVSCTFCRERGHNRLSCVERKNRLQKYIALNAEYLSVLNQKIALEGFGVGALISYKHYYASNPSIHIIKEYDFTSAVFALPDTVRPLNCSHLTPPDGDGYYNPWAYSGNQRIILPVLSQNTASRDTALYDWDMEHVIQRSERVEVLTPSYRVTEVPLKVIAKSCEAAMNHKSRYNPVRDLPNFDATMEKWSKIISESKEELAKIQLTRSESSAS
jgi:hypothetical protein